MCQAYWGAVYVFVRRQVGDVHEAQDLTQAFFTRLLEKNLLVVAQPARSRFRSFLLTSVRNFMHNEWDKQQALKRGGRQKHFALDFQQQDSTYALEPADTLTPERLYERQWVLALLEQVMTRLHALRRPRRVAAGPQTSAQDMTRPSAPRGTINRQKGER